MNQQQASGSAARRLAGERAFVTGAAAGIGEAIATAFAHEGAAVFCADINADGAASVAQALDGAASGHCDVADEASVKAAIEHCTATLGSPSVLVCNAATFTPVVPVEALSLDDWRSALDVNLTGAFLVCKHGIPCLRAGGGGAVILTASQMGRVGSPGQAAYCATKGALLQLCKVMALDHAHENIRVNTLSPGGTATDRLARRFGSLQEAEQRWGPRHPLGRLGRVEEIARAAVFLASADASFMTGSDLLVDGGYAAQ